MVYHKLVRGSIDGKCDCMIGVPKRERIGGKKGRCHRLFPYFCRATHAGNSHAGGSNGCSVGVVSYADDGDVLENALQKVAQFFKR